jgi:hypothetical protein
MTEAPSPTSWIDQANRRTADELREAAAELRRAVTTMADRLLELAAYDRPDVWQGAVADRFRHDRADALRRVASPTSGAFPALADAAARLDARAAAHDAAVPATPIAPQRLDPVELLLRRWETDRDSPR